jgi:hypothetical protein
LRDKAGTTLEAISATADAQLKTHAPRKSLSGWFLCSLVGITDKAVKQKTKSPLN